MKQDTPATSHQDVLVFAYGSNMCRQRILARTPSARLLMTGSVNGFRLAFHKRSVDGSAKADAFFTDNPSDEVWGVVAQMSRADKSILDQFESLGIGYDEITVDVAHEHGVTSAWMYVARQEMIDDSLLPYSWYHNYVRAGALEHGLPQSYIEFIESFSSIEDPDHIRDLENRIE